MAINLSTMAHATARLKSQVSSYATSTQGLKDDALICNEAGKVMGPAERWDTKVIKKLQAFPYLFHSLKIQQAKV